DPIVRTKGPEERYFELPISCPVHCPGFSNDLVESSFGPATVDDFDIAIWTCLVLRRSVADALALKEHRKGGDLVPPARVAFEIDVRHALYRQRISRGSGTAECDDANEQSKSAGHRCIHGEPLRQLSVAGDGTSVASQSPYPSKAGHPMCIRDSARPSVSQTKSDLPRLQ